VKQPHIVAHEIPKMSQIWKSRHLLLLKFSQKIRIPSLYIHINYQNQISYREITLTETETAAGAAAWG
jgi:hypothetical protein